MSENYEYRRGQVREGKVPVRTKILQGFGGLVNSHKDFAFGTFLLLYYSQILGLSASLVSVVVALSLIVDAVSDPIVGSMSDNYKSKLGRRHPFMFAAAIPFGITMYCLFTPPSGLGDWALLAWLACFTIAARIAFTFFIIPWNAIAAEFSQDYVERTSIITYRYMVGWVGGVMFFVFTWSYLFPNTEAYPAGQLNPANYSTFGLIVGCLVILWAFISSLGTKDQIPYLLQPVHETPSTSIRSVVSDTLMALKNANFLRLFVLFFIFSGVAGVGGVFDIYMNTYFWEFTPDELRWFALSAIGAICAFIAIPFLQKIIDKHILLQWFLAAVMILAMLKVCFRFWDIWPENGDPLLLQLLICHSVVQTFLLTTCGIMVASLVADLMDEQELETGKRQEGVFSAALSFSAKATTSVGIVIGGLVLDFVVALEKQAPVGSVDDGTLFRLAFSDGIAVPLLFFIPIYLISTITMTRSRLAEVQAQLGEKRALVTVNDSDEGDGAREG